MELFISIISVLILAETTFMVAKSRIKFNSNPRRKVFVDTSAVMDGRILAVAETGFLGDEYLIPRSVIREMQLLADGSDADKRARARAGLDTVNGLERVVEADFKIFADDLGRVKVDERLIALAKEERGAILTNDFNLGKVAKTENIEVLNVNDLALALRHEFLPGERFSIEIKQKGNNAGQGVGYLPDGTMVVVDRASDKVGKTLEVEFVRFLQTSAGKMSFAKKVTERGRKSGR